MSRQRPFFRPTFPAGITSPFLHPMKRNLSLGLWWAPLVLALVLVPAVVMRAADPMTGTSAQSGVITGFVSNAATNKLLAGANVELPQLGLSTLTDDTGRFWIGSVPAGVHELTVAYIGLDPTRSSVSVSTGSVTRQDFDLKTGIYTMSEFKVTGEREGSAAAITAHRNATNLKNVVSTDTFGNLPHMSATELALSLPGVAGNFSEDDVVAQLSIRGMGPGLNVITVDGSLLTSEGGLNRNTRMYNMTSAMFEQIELIKGHTPDKSADSLGGTINLKSRSALNMKENRRVPYNVSGVLAPAFTEQNPLREEHRFHPKINFGYQGVFGPKRNLGVALNLYYSENVSAAFATIRDFQNSASFPRVSLGLSDGG